MSPDWAWAAGLFEGEGCISIRSERPGVKGGTNLWLSMTDLDVVERFRLVVGAGAVRPKACEAGRKTLYVWRCGRWEDVERILTAFMPLLGQRRRERAMEALARPARRVGRPDRAECPQGHRKEGDNLYVTPAGVKVCRRCQREAQRRYRRRKHVA